MKAGKSLSFTAPHLLGVAPWPITIARRVTCCEKTSTHNLIISIPKNDFHAPRCSEWGHVCWILQHGTARRSVWWARSLRRISIIDVPRFTNKIRIGSCQKFEQKHIPHYVVASSTTTDKKPYISLGYIAKTRFWLNIQYSRSLQMRYLTQKGRMLPICMVRCLKSYELRFLCARLFHKVCEVFSTTSVSGVCETSGLNSH